MGIGPSPGSETPMAEINVTPLVDVMLVLLIIFMVTVPMMDQGLPLDLPKTKGGPIDSSAEEQLVLAIQKDKTLFLNKSRLSVGSLKEKLPGIMGARKDRTLFIRADKDVPYGFVALVVGEVRMAGVTKLGLVTLPLEEEK